MCNALGSGGSLDYHRHRGLHRYPDPERHGKTQTAMELPLSGSFLDPGLSDRSCCPEWLSLALRVRSESTL